VSKRTLSGHSYGGLFAGLALLLEDPANRFFTNYLSQDGSFWHQPVVTTSLEQQLASNTNSLPVKVILSGAFDGNGRDVEWFRDLLAARSYVNLDLNHWEYNGSHEGQFLLSMEDLLELLY
jgi:predicted alpha/beta superfamily hydrolase